MTGFQHRQSAHCESGVMSSLLTHHRLPTTEPMAFGLGDALATSFLMTPEDFQDRLLSFRGAGFSFEPRLQQSAWFRPHNRSEDVQHLYLVGAGTHPGAGIPGVLSSARVLDEIVPHASLVR